MASGKWWVTETAVRGPSGGVQQYSAVQSLKRPRNAVDGPFPDKAAADAKIKSLQSFSVPGSGIVHDLASGWHDVTGTADALTKFFGELSDPAMWRSLGWLGLGVAMMASGAYLWVRQSQVYRRAETAVSTAIIGHNPAPDLTHAGKIQTPLGEAPVIPILLLLTGGYLAWFGVHYWRDEHTIWPSDPAKDVLRGLGLPKPDRSPSVADQISSVSSGAGSQAGQFGEASGDAIAKDAASYAGKVPYKWGGASPATGWDCSGLVNYVLAHDMGLDIPGYRGGTFTGAAHGPNVAGWLASSLVDVVHAGPVS